MNFFQEQYTENKRKVQVIERWIKQYKADKLTPSQLRTKLTKLLSKLIGVHVPVYIIDKTYPFIFVNVDTGKLDFRVTGIYISEAILDKFSAGEVTAAILHYTGVYQEFAKQPDIIKWVKKQRYSEQHLAVLFKLFGSLSELGIATRVILRTVPAYEKALSTALIVLSFAIAVKLIAYVRGCLVTSEVLRSGDSFAVKYGYGKELASFIARYDSPAYLYGKAKKDIAYIVEILRYFAKLVGTLPTERQRVCRIAQQITRDLERGFPKEYFKSELYDWAVQTVNLNCSQKMSQPTVPRGFVKVSAPIIKFLLSLAKRRGLKESADIEPHKIVFKPYSGECDIPGCQYAYGLWSFADRKYKVFVNGKFCGYVAIANQNNKQAVAIILQTDNPELLSAIVKEIEDKFGIKNFTVDLPKDLEPSPELKALSNVSDIYPGFVRYAYQTTRLSTRSS
ncbi:MAG: hypothetical protein DRI57_05310 [Deltaproteobacteria bacterium]|nr:MAG: hypothetical protein DRI57_05310 [Deltaproteobacteria bacterium]